MNIEYFYIYICIFISLTVTYFPSFLANSHLTVDRLQTERKKKKNKTIKHYCIILSPHVGLKKKKNRNPSNRTFARHRVVTLTNT
jgi:hypothetical protein